MLWVMTTNREYVNVTEALKIIIEGLNVVACFADGSKEILAATPDIATVERCYNLLQVSMEKPNAVCSLLNITQQR